MFLWHQCTFFTVLAVASPFSRAPIFRFIIVMYCSEILLHRDIHTVFLLIGQVRSISLTPLISRGVVAESLSEHLLEEDPQDPTT